MDTTVENKVKHTELPWIVSPYGYPFEKSRPALIWSQKTINGNQKHIANVLDRIPYPGMNEIGYHLISVEEKNANAEYIVRACNSHYDLLEALKNIIEDVQAANIRDDYYVSKRVIENAKAILEKSNLIKKA